MKSAKLEKFANNLPRELYDFNMKYRGHRDRIFTHLIMMDYDWLHYRIQAELPIEDGKIMLVEFKNMGAVISEMNVQIDKTYVGFKFSSDLFDELLEKYLNKQLYAIQTHNTFYGGDLILDYYNKVMQTYTEIEYCGTPVILPQQ